MYVCDCDCGFDFDFDFDLKMGIRIRDEREEGEGEELGVYTEVGGAVMYKGCRADGSGYSAELTGGADWRARK